MHRVTPVMDAGPTSFEVHSLAVEERRVSGKSGHEQLISQTVKRSALNQG